MTFIVLTIYNDGKPPEITQFQELQMAQDYVNTIYLPQDHIVSVALLVELEKWT